MAKRPEEPVWTATAVAMPVGGYKPPAEPAPITKRAYPDEECFRRDAPRLARLMEIADAYCGRDNRWLPKTRAYFMDGKGDECLDPS